MGTVQLGTVQVLYCAVTQLAAAATCRTNSCTSFGATGVVGAWGVERAADTGVPILDGIGIGGIGTVELVTRLDGDNDGDACKVCLWVQRTQADCRRTVLRRGPLVRWAALKNKRH